MIQMSIRGGLIASSGYKINPLSYLFQIFSCMIVFMNPNRSFTTCRTQKAVNI